VLLLFVAVDLQIARLVVAMSSVAWGLGKVPLSGVLAASLMKTWYSLNRVSTVRLVLRRKCFEDAEKLR
jgi:hypothetical protein